MSTSKFKKILGMAAVAMVVIVRVPALPPTTPALFSAVTVDTNNVLLPANTNLFDKNIGPLTNALNKAGYSPGGGGGATGGAATNAVVAVAQTNAPAPSVSADKTTLFIPQYVLPTGSVSLATNSVVSTNDPTGRPLAQMLSTNGSGAGLTGITPGQVGADASGAAAAAAAAATNGYAPIATGIANGAVASQPMPAGNLSGVVPLGNMSGLVVTNDAATIAFLATNGIINPDAQTRVSRMVSTLRSYGIYNGYFCDGLLLKPYFNPTNQRSFFGRPFASSNLTYSSFGANFNNSLVNLPLGAVDLRSNVLVIVWHIPPAQFTAGEQFIGGLVNSNAGSAFWHGYLNPNYERYFIRDQGNVWPSGNGSIYTNLMQMQSASGSFGYGVEQTRPTERRVSGMAINGTLVSIWDNGHPGAVTLNSYAMETNGLSFVSAPNAIQLGMDTTNSLFGPFNGEIDCALLFTNVGIGTPLYTNVMIGATVASRCLELENYDDIWWGDSLIAPQFANGAVGVGIGTNCPAWFFENRGSRANSFTWRNEAIGGTKMDIEWKSQTASNFLFSVPEPPGVQRYLIGGAGINDLYGTGASAATVWADYLNFLFWCRINQTKCIVFTLAPIWTNCSAYTYSATVEAQRVMLNNLILTNAYLFDGIFRRDLIVNQDAMNTNAFLFSADGLHFIGDANHPLGWQMNQRIAQSPSSLDDLGQSPRFDWEGNLYAKSYVGDISGGTNFPVTGINASGTASGATYLRGDGSWQTPATNITAGTSSTNLLGTDSSGHQVAVPWGNLPTGGGTANTVQTNNLGFVAAAVGLTNSGNTISGNGAGLMALNASAISSGTMPLASLPASAVTNATSAAQQTVISNGAAAFVIGGGSYNNFIILTNAFGGIYIDKFGALNGLVGANSHWTIDNSGNFLGQTVSVMTGGQFNGSGAGLTNLPFFKTLSISGGASVAFSVNADGSTNVIITAAGPSAALTNAPNVFLSGNVFMGSLTGSNGMSLWGTATVNGAAVMTNVTLGTAIKGSNGAAVSWMLGMDSSGNLATNPVPSGGATAAATTNGANVFTAANVFMQQVNFSNGLAAYGGISSSGAGTNQFGATQFTNPIPGTAVAALYLDANNTVVTGAVASASSSGTFGSAFRASVGNQNAGTAANPQYIQDGGTGFNSSLTQVQMPTGYHIFTNWYVNIPYPSINAGTNVTFVLNTNGVDSGYNVICHGPWTAGSPNIFSNTTSSLTIAPGTLVAVKITNNTPNGISGFWVMTSIQ